MKINAILSSLLAGIKTKLPSMLALYDLPDFDAYGIGYPTDQNKTFCAVRYASGEGYENPRLTFTVHIQLPGIEELVAYKYMDAVNDYLHKLDGGDYGMPVKTVKIELLENFRFSDTQAFFDVTLSGLAEDCEEEF